MARAKSTARAEARRRYRAAQAELEQPEGTEDEETSDGDGGGAPRNRTDRTSEPASAGARPSILANLRRPDVMGDLRAMPGVMRSTRLLWLPFVLIAVGGAMFAASSDQGSVGLFVGQLTLYPTPLIVYFVAGFLAPRGSYIVGAASGLLDGIIVSFLALGQVGPFKPAEGATSQTADIGIMVSYVVLQVVMGTFGAAFAAWYRAFLRNTSARSRQNAEAKKKAQRRDARRPDPKRPASSTR